MDSEKLARAAYERQIRISKSQIPFAEKVERARIETLELELAQRASNEVKLANVVTQLRRKLDEFKQQNSTNVKYAETELARLASNVHRSSEAQNVLEARCMSLGAENATLHARAQELDRQSTTMARLLEAHRKEFTALDHKHVLAMEEMAMLKEKLVAEEESSLALRKQRQKSETFLWSMSKTLDTYQLVEEYQISADAFRDRYCLRRSHRLWRFHVSLYTRVKWRYRNLLLPLRRQRLFKLWVSNTRRRCHARKMSRRREQHRLIDTFGIWVHHTRQCAHFRTRLHRVQWRSSRVRMRMSLQEWHDFVQAQIRASEQVMGRTRIRLALRHWNRCRIKHKKLKHFVLLCLGKADERQVRSYLQAWRIYTKCETLRALFYTRSGKDTLGQVITQWRHLACKRLDIARLVPNLYSRAISNRSGRGCFAALKWWAALQKQARKLQKSIRIRLGRDYLAIAMTRWRLHLEKKKEVLASIKIYSTDIKAAHFHEWATFVRLKKKMGEAQKRYFVFESSLRKDSFQRWVTVVRGNRTRIQRLRTMRNRLHLDITNIYWRRWLLMLREAGVKKETTLQIRVEELEQTICSLGEASKELESERSRISVQLQDVASKQTKDRTDTEANRRSLIMQLTKTEESLQASHTQIEELVAQRKMFAHEEKMLASELRESHDMQETLRNLLRHNEEQRMLLEKSRNQEETKVAQLKTQLDEIRSTMLQLNKNVESENEELREKVFELKVRVKELQEQLDHKDFCVKTIELELRRVQHEKSLVLNGSIRTNSSQTRLDHVPY